MAASARSGSGVRHLDLGAAQPGAQFVEPAGGQHPVHGHDVQIAGAGVLREVADGAAAADRAGRGQGVPGQHLEQGCLARPVPAHEANAITGGDLEAAVFEQQARPRAQFDATGHNQRNPLPLFSQRMNAGHQSAAAALVCRRLRTVPKEGVETR